MEILYILAVLAFPAAIAGALLFLNAEIARGRGDGRAAAIMAVIDGLALGAAVWTVCSFTLNWYNRALYIAMAVTVEAFLILWMIHRLNRKTLGLLLGLFALLIAGRVGTDQYGRYLERIRVRDSFDARLYRPFEENSLVKTLDEPSALRFTENPPRLDGATALYPVYSAFARAVFPDSFWDMDRTARLQYINCESTAGAYRNIVDGKADMIFVAGPSAEQEAYAKEKRVELKYTPIGREAFVFFVNPQNPVDALTVDQLRGIYSGKITRWEEVGAQGLGGILAFQRREGSGSQTALRKLMGDTVLMEAPKETMMDSMLGIVEATSDYRNFKNAIGYSFRFYCTELITDFQVKLLRVNGVSPTRENIENGAYPLASSFFAVTRADADENTRALLDWILSAQGQRLIDETGYTPINGTGAKEEGT